MMNIGVDKTKDSNRLIQMEVVKIAEGIIPLAICFML